MVNNDFEPGQWCFSVSSCDFQSLHISPSINPAASAHNVATTQRKICSKHNKSSPEIKMFNLEKLYKNL